LVENGTLTLKKGLAEMLKNGVLMDVTSPEQAKIAEEAGACAVMALERVPADIRRRCARMAPARAKVIVVATTHYNDPHVLPEVSRDLGEAMHGL